MIVALLVGQIARHVCITCCCIFARHQHLCSNPCHIHNSLHKPSSLAPDFPNRRKFPPPENLPTSDPTRRVHVKVDPCGSNISTILSSGNREFKLSDCGSSTCPIQRYHCRYQRMCKLYGGRRCARDEYTKTHRSEHEHTPSKQCLSRQKQEIMSISGSIAHLLVPFGAATAASSYRTPSACLISS
jgi:hypothetical protein